MRFVQRWEERRRGGKPRGEASGLTGDQLILAVGGVLLATALLADAQPGVLMIIAAHTLLFAGAFYVNRLTWPADGE